MDDGVSRDVALVAGLLMDNGLAALANISDDGMTLAAIEASCVAARSAGVILLQPRGSYLVSEGGVPRRSRVVAVVGRTHDDQTSLVVDMTLIDIGSNLRGLRLDRLFLTRSVDFELTLAGLRRLRPPTVSAEAAQRSAHVPVPADRRPPGRFEPAVVAVVGRMAAGDIAGLRADGIAPPDGDLLLWVRQYGDHGATIAVMPADGWQYVEGFPVDDDRSHWVLLVPVWTVEHGHSDLTLELEGRDAPSGVTVTITDLRVM